MLIVTNARIHDALHVGDPALGVISPNSGIKTTPERIAVDGCCASY
jgi:hypothetical protein